jgi:hypothetical protein
MNAATAGGLLGGDVRDSGQCKFARVGDPKITLRIDVAVMQSVKTEFPSYLDKCRSDVKPLKAIGNEAVVCTWDAGERVVGRVRDQVFVITLTTPDVSVEKMRKAAEIVSGNLF